MAKPRDVQDSLFDVADDNKDLPCSTTAVERGVKENTAVATMVSGAWQQDMVSWNRVSARERNALRQSLHRRQNFCKNA